MRVGLRKDGFASLATTGQGRVHQPPTVVQTVAMRVGEASRLFINAAALGGGRLVVSVVDAASGEVVVGRGASVCTPMIGDQKSATVAWAGGGMVAPGKLALRFEMTGQVDLFSFWMG